MTEVEKTVPMRKQEVYQTDDGRKIEVFSICGSVELVNDNDEIHEFSNDTIYVGVVHIATEAGPTEIKFEIPRVNSIEEAFDSYQETATLAIEEMQRRREEMKKQYESQIVTAPKEALQALDQNNSGGKIII